MEKMAAARNTDVVKAGLAAEAGRAARRGKSDADEVCLSPPYVSSVRILL